MLWPVVYLCIEIHHYNTKANINTSGPPLSKKVPHTKNIKKFIFVIKIPKISTRQLLHNIMNYSKPIY